ncbi:MAG: ABC transporter ATP-binding protein [Patescibacteria group bacterium]
MITLHEASKYFGEKRAVQSVSFTVKTGEVVGFLGLNGAGKTTTMRLITGYYSPTSGTVTVDTHNPITEHVSVSKKIGYLPENNPLYGDMKVREYLEFIREVKKHGSIQEIIEEVGLVDVMDKKIEQLSRGYKQRVGLAAALLGNPSILILDEPTSGLDPVEQEKIRHLIKKLAESKIIIFSTHILSEVADVATRLIIINGGKLVYDGEKPASLSEIEKLFKEKVASSLIA